MAPVVHGLEVDYGDKINFIYLDIDDLETNVYKQRLGYQYQPHIFLIDPGGNIVEQWVGYVSGETLETAIKVVSGES